MTAFRNSNCECRTKLFISPKTGQCVFNCQPLDFFPDKSEPCHTVGSSQSIGVYYWAPPPHPKGGDKNEIIFLSDGHYSLLWFSRRAGSFSIPNHPAPLPPPFKKEGRAGHAAHWAESTKRARPDVYSKLSAACVCVCARAYESTVSFSWAVGVSSRGRRVVHWYTRWCCAFWRERWTSFLLADPVGPAILKVLKDSVYIHVVLLANIVFIIGGL